jgi:hypothetical protein
MAQMLLDDLIEIIGLNEPIPDLLGINHNGRAMLTLLQATRFVDAQHTGQLRRSDLVFEQLMQFTLPIGTAGRPRRSSLTLVGANENMSIE